MPAELIALRLIHILSGTFWVGSALFTTVFLMPALATAGPAAGQVMAAMQRRRLMTVLPIVAVLTILSGLRLLWIASAGFSRPYFASATGHTFAAAGAAAILSFVLSLVVARPAALRSSELARSLPNVPAEQRPTIERELARLRRRGATTSAVVVTLLVLSAAGMAVARYLG